VRHDHEAVEPRLGDGSHAAGEDRLAGEPHELLGHLGAESVAGAAGEDQAVGTHRRGAFIGWPRG